MLQADEIELTLILPVVRDSTAHQNNFYMAGVTDKILCVIKYVVM